MKKLLSVVFVCLFASTAFAAETATAPLTVAYNDAPKATSTTVKKKHVVKKTVRKASSTPHTAK